MKITKLTKIAQTNFLPSTEKRPMSQEDFRQAKNDIDLPEKRGECPLLQLWG